MIVKRKSGRYSMGSAWRDMDFWIAWIQEVIVKHGRVDQKRRHPSFPHLPWCETDVRKWTREFVDRVVQLTGGDKSARYDGNLSFAAVAGLILVGWFLACGRAKTLDPRRRLKERRKAHRNMRKYVTLLTDLIYDFHLSARGFPNQPWDVTLTKSERQQGPLKLTALTRASKSESVFRTLLGPVKVRGKGSK